MSFPPFRLVVVGASAGGVDALLKLARNLPRDFPAPVFVVLHMASDSPSLLDELLSRAGPLPAAHPTDGEPVRGGRIYVAPPDQHLMLAPGHVLVRRGPRENHVRPAVDPLFRSAAVAYGPAVVGVVLTGTLYDGSAGLKAIKQHGGVAIVQDPKDAMFPSMPESALRATDVDYCVPLRDIPRVLRELVMAKPRTPGAEASPLESAGAVPAPQPVTEPEPATPVPPGDADAIETKIAAGADDSLELLRRIAAPSSYTCPECNGALWEIRDPAQLRFRCRVGHAFTVDSLLYELDNEVEGALWSALRALEERAALNARAAERPEVRSLAGLVDRFRERQEESERDAKLLRRLLEGGVDKLAG